MAKTNRFQAAAPVSTALKLAKDNDAIITLLAGKTLYEVGKVNGFDDSNVTIEYSKNTKTGAEIPSLGLKIDGQLFTVPFSRSFKFDQMGNAEWFLGCEFRKGHLSMKDDAGAPLMDENGKIVLDTTSVYITIGNPSGLRSIRSEGAFAEMTEEEVAEAAGA